MNTFLLILLILVSIPIIAFNLTFLISFLMLIWQSLKFIIIIILAPIIWLLEKLNIIKEEEPKK